MRQVEIDEDRIEALQGHDGRARAQILPDVDRADAELSGKRCLQGLLLEKRALLFDERLRVLEIGPVAVERRLADGIELDLLLVAPDHDGVVLGRGLQRAQLRGVVDVDELEENRAGFHAVARVEFDALHDAGDLQRKIRAIHGAQRPDGALRRLPRDDLGDRRGDGLLRIGHAGDGRADHAGLEGLEPVEPAEQEPHAEEHDGHALDHRITSLLARLSGPAKSPGR